MHLLFNFICILLEVSLHSLWNMDGIFSEPSRESGDGRAGRSVYLRDWEKRWLRSKDASPQPRQLAAILGIFLSPLEKSTRVVIRDADFVLRSQCIPSRTS
ncbi:hypothetical protein CDAR_463051 [Caerostris darwini]|uniref:Secreted protein n=1 Tax=Caerostris darwini TaxID=1538125 RepID=A0AAV4QBE7_9ARAC|nr:hypothetical protein CDAR_463051 [Caerostris darwini]